eukprot:6195005-Pleurochrysis_carterae.AAC.7
MRTCACARVRACACARARARVVRARAWHAGPACSCSKKRLTYSSSRLIDGVASLPRSSPEIDPS